MTDPSLTENKQKSLKHARDIDDRLIESGASDNLRELVLRIIDVTYDYGFVDGLKSAADKFGGGNEASYESLQPHLSSSLSSVQASRMACSASSMRLYSSHSMLT